MLERPLSHYWTSPLSLRFKFDPSHKIVICKFDLNCVFEICILHLYLFEKKKWKFAEINEMKWNEMKWSVRNALISCYIQCVPIKRKPVLSVRYLHCHASFNQIICFIIMGIFSSFIWYQTHDDISMKITENQPFNSWMSKSICAEWCWVDMTKFRLANPCQNKESKQKKHDKRNANECLCNTPLCYEMWQSLLSPYLLFCANKFWHHNFKWFVLGHAWPIHLVSGVKRTRMNWILQQFNFFW